MISTSVSTLNVENVVYAPSKPVPAKARAYRVGGNRSISRTSRNPSTNEPETLVQNVAHGNLPGGTVIHVASL